MTDGTQMSKEQIEAFGLGQSLGEIKTVLQGVRTDVTEVKGTTAGMAGDLTQIKITLAEHSTRIQSHDEDIRDLKAAPNTYATKAEHEQLRAEVVSSRLSWPKLLTGAGVIIAGAALLLNWAAQLGAFQR
jgi:hypothetical protein